MARPLKGKTNLDRQLKIRLEEADYLRLIIAAKGRNLSDYVRDLLRASIVNDLPKIIT